MIAAWITKGHKKTMELPNMLPYLPKPNGIYDPSGNHKFFSYYLWLTSVFNHIFNPFYFFIGEFRILIHFAPTVITTISSFALRIRHIFHIAANPKMIWIKTRRVIAARTIVANQFFTRKIKIKKSECRKSMGVVSLVGKTNPSITPKKRASVYPTTSSFIYSSAEKKFSFRRFFRDVLFYQLLSFCRTSVMPKGVMFNAKTTAAMYFCTSFDRAFSMMYSTATNHTFVSLRPLRSFARGLAVFPILYI